jgi:hypothetical protein
MQRFRRNLIKDNCKSLNLNLNFVKKKQPFKSERKMKKFVIIFLILLGISDTELFSQEISQRQEFNRLLYGLWKGETTGSISKYENLMTMLISPSEMATSAGFYLGEVIMKDFRYLGDDKFECLAKVKNVENGLIKEEWIKAKIAICLF